MDRLTEAYGAMVASHDAMAAASSTGFDIGPHPYMVSLFVAVVAALVLPVCALFLVRAGLDAVPVVLLLLFGSVVASTAATDRLGVSFPPVVPTEVAMAADAACGGVLDLVSSGEVRWMPPKWEANVIQDCGDRRFSVSANSIGSRYAVR